MSTPTRYLKCSTALNVSGQLKFEQVAPGCYVNHMTGLVLMRLGTFRRGEPGHRTTETKYGFRGFGDTGLSQQSAMSYLDRALARALGRAFATLGGAS